MSRPEFLYFDLGNVLLRFDHGIGCRNMAELAGVSPDLVRRIVFEADLEHRYERGDLTSSEFYELFCTGTESRPDCDQLYRAAADIFEPHTPVLELVQRLRELDWPLGILSNTCEAHWEFCLAEYPVLTAAFPVHALSFRLNRMKPEPEIYLRAAELAGVAPQAIFFTDDREENVAGALAAGFDATLFTSPEQLQQDLQARGLLD